MKIKWGKGTSEFGTGVQINLTTAEVSRAIHAYLVCRGVNIDGSRTLQVGGEMEFDAGIYVDPSGGVFSDKHGDWSGSGSD